MIPVRASVHPVRDYFVFALDMAKGPYTDYELDVEKFGNGRPAVLTWIKPFPSPISIRINDKNSEPIPISSEELPLVLDGIEISKLYVTATATSGKLYIVVFYPK